MFFRWAMGMKRRAIDFKGVDMRLIAVPGVSSQIKVQMVSFPAPGGPERPTISCFEGFKSRVPSVLIKSRVLEPQNSKP